MASEIKFESWAVVEVMGHSRYAGYVQEQSIGGQSFIRVDVPEANGRAGFTKFLGGASIFAITPCTEEVARRAAEAVVASPIQFVDLVRRSAPSMPMIESGQEADFDDDEYSPGDEE